MLDSGILAKIRTEAEVEYSEYEKDPADTTAEPDKLEQENTSPDETGQCQHSHMSNELVGLDIISKWFILNFV